MESIRACFEARGLSVASVPFSHVANKPIDGANTVLITALPYYFPQKEGYNLARFAALPDYHVYFGGILKEICNQLQSLYPDGFFLPYTDNSPIDEQKAALESGLAIRGKNHLCITKQGSFVFLGEVITDLDVSLRETPPKNLCENCNLCRKACPNGALTEEGFAYEKCLAYITQKKGELSEEERSALQKHRIAWGCDQCGEACPHNRGLPTAAIALPPNEVSDRIRKEDLEGLSDRQFREKYAQRAFAWRGKATMLRNLTILEESEHGNER